MGLQLRSSIGASIMNLEEIAELKSNYLNEMFKLMNFSEEEWQVINSLNLFRYFRKGTVLLKNGQYSENSYYVVKGCLVSYYMVDGVENVADFYAERDLFVPSCITTNKPSNLYLTCLEDCLVSVGNAENEKIMLDNFPRFEKLCRIATEKSLQEEKTKFDRFKFASPEERYINFAKDRPDLLQRIPQYQIASYLGLTPQSLSRIRKRMLKEMKCERMAV